MCQNLSCHLDRPLLNLLQGEAFETDKIDAVMGDLDESEEVEATWISYIFSSIYYKVLKNIKKYCY